MTSSVTAASLPGGNTVLVEIVDRVAWVTMNRPEKRNAINPALSFEMLEVFEALDSDERCGALVLTGAGEAYSSGMDLREYFRATDKLSYDERLKVMRKSAMAQWKRLQFYGKPTIAMVNGWCFGGAFNSMIACDLAIAADDATFGLSEINWGIIPAGVVTKAVAQVMSQRVEMATQLVKDVTHDLESLDVDFDTPGLPELNKAVLALSERLSKLFPR